MLNSCMSPHYLKQSLLEKTSQRHFKVKTFHKNGLPVLCIYKLSKSTVARLYIEGDGRSWLSKTVISDNPTPKDPVAYHLMEEDLSTYDLYYLSRPCQYCWTQACTLNLWTSDRFSEEVLQAYNQILDDLKTNYTSFEIVAYSGGAAIALLLAAKRQDITKVTTFAGLTDSKYWCTLKKFTPLKNSLNPADFTEKLERIEQVHFVGGKDNNVPKEVMQHYLKKYSNTEKITLLVTDNFDHFSDWPSLWKTYQQQKT